MSEDWNPKKVAAECAAAARAKTGPSPADPPPITITSKPSAADEYRDELGKFKAGHPVHPGAGGDGKPSKYKPEYIEQARRLAQIGASNHEMADYFEVAYSTFMLWRNVHPEFNEAVKVGKEKPDDRTERSLYERANGYDYTEEVAIKVKVGKNEERIEIVQVKKHAPPDTGAMAIWLTNRRPEQWKHKRTIEHMTPDGAVSPDEARRALADYYRGGGGEVIDVTPTRLSLPESGGVISDADDI